MIIIRLRTYLIERISKLYPYNYSLLQRINVALSCYPFLLCDAKPYFSKLLEGFSTLNSHERLPNSNLAFNQVEKVIKFKNKFTLNNYYTTIDQL